MPGRRKPPLRAGAGLHGGDLFTIGFGVWGQFKAPGEAGLYHQLPVSLRVEDSRLSNMRAMDFKVSPRRPSTAPMASR